MKTETKIAAGILLGIFTLFTVVKLMVFSGQSLQWHVVTSVAGLVMLGVIGLIVRTVDRALDKRFPFERNPFWRIVMQFFITLIAIVFVRLATIPLFYDYLVVKPTPELLIAGFTINIFMVLSLVLSIFGYHFFRRWREEKILAAELEKEKALVQYDNLKNQLNPHFLFNSLSSLNSLIFENPPLASDFLQQLSKVYRYVLDNKDKNLVTLQTETAFVGHYATLLQTRFANALQITFAIDDENRARKIVPVTLQILFENAIKHNIATPDTPLHITVSCSDGYLLVQNNLQRKHIIETSNGQGLDNLKNLYRYLSEQPVVVEETTRTFCVKIPLIN